MKDIAAFSHIATNGVTATPWSRGTMHGVKFKLPNGHTFSVIFGFGSNTNNKWLETTSFNEALSQATSFEAYAWDANGVNWEDVESYLTPDQLYDLILTEAAK